MSVSPSLPTRPPIKQRQSSFPWLTVVSLGLNVITLLIVLIGFSLLGLFQPSRPFVPIKAESATQEPASGTQEPAVTEAPIIQAASLEFPSNKEEFGFEESVNIPFELKNISPQDIRFELLKANGEVLSPETIGLSNTESEVSLPAGHAVGNFKVRAMNQEEELGSFEFVIKPPEFNLTDVLKVQPNINFNGQYIFIPEASTITLNDANKNWKLNTALVDKQEASITENTIALLKDYTSDGGELPLTIEMPGVVDQDGKVYIYQTSLPVLAQMPISQDINLGKPLIKYDVFENKFPNDETNAQVLDKVSPFKDGSIFSLGEVALGDKSYIKVMIIGKINPSTLSSTPEFKNVVLDNVTPYLFPDPTKIVEPNDKALRTLDGKGVATILQGATGTPFFFVKNLESGSFEIVLFGVIEK